MTTTQKLAAIPLAAAMLLGGGAVAGYAGLAAAQTSGAPAPWGQATSTPWGMHRGPGGPMGMHAPHGVMGTVSAINGSTLTVTGKDGKTYTVDAGAAKVTKVVELSVGDIKVGDTIGAEGALSGTTVTAEHIMDGVPPNPPQSQTH